MVILRQTNRFQFGTLIMLSGIITMLDTDVCLHVSNKSRLFGDGCNCALVRAKEVAFLS